MNDHPYHSYRKSFNGEQNWDSAPKLLSCEAICEKISQLINQFGKKFLKQWWRCVVKWLQVQNNSVSIGAILCNSQALKIKILFTEIWPNMSS